MFDQPHPLVSVESSGPEHVCAGIQYLNDEGQGVHSDLCTDSVDAWSDETYRKLLHDSLDEFLNAKDQTGLFFVGFMDPEEFN